MEWDHETDHVLISTWKKCLIQYNHSLTDLRGHELEKRKTWMNDADGNKFRLIKGGRGEASGSGSGKRMKDESATKMPDQDPVTSEDTATGNMLRSVVGPEPPLPPLDNMLELSRSRQ